MNTVGSYYALLKRGMMGSFHSVSEAHMHRYLAEFDFRDNTRNGDVYLENAGYESHKVGV